MGCPLPRGSGERRDVVVLDNEALPSRIPIPASVCVLPLLDELTTTVRVFVIYYFMPYESL